MIHRPRYPRYYVLDENKKPVPTDMVTWARTFEGRLKEQLTGTDPWRVSFDRVSPRCEVSTVFLGLDHSFDREPVLYETLILGGPLDGEITRYHTSHQAETGHRFAVARAKAATDTIKSIAEACGAVPPRNRP